MQTLNYPRSLEEAEAFDLADPLADKRGLFDLPEGVTYLVGHSLGPASRSALERVQSASEQEWARGLVGSWNSAGWIDMPKHVGGRLARLIGVEAEEVVVCDSVSLNIYKLAAALAETMEEGAALLVGGGEFPTDQYILDGLARGRSFDFQRMESGAGPDALKAGCVWIKSLVDYRTAAVADVEAFENRAQEVGAAMIWDLSHATGVLDLKLAEWGAKYAVGCTYKYLNGGPGAPGFAYVRKDCVNGLRTPLQGWLGHASPFEFSPRYQPAPGVQRFVSGTPAILSMAALDGALDVFDGVAASDLETKARALGDMCLVRFGQLGLETSSPSPGARRGGHVSVRHENGYAVSRALAERGCQTDFRTPDTIRFGLSPLYLGYGEVWRALDALEDILESGVWREDRFSVRAKVT